MKRRIRYLCGILLVALAVVLATGCQAIGGVDLNQAFLKNLDIQSVEGSGTVSLEFTPAAGVADSLTAVQAEELKAISPMKLHLDHVKTEDRGHASVKGSLEIPRGKIPFEAYMTNEELVMKLDGAKKPFVLKMGDFSTGYATGMAGGLGGGMMGMGGMGGMGGIAGAAGDDAAMTKAMAEMQSKMQNPEVIKPLYSYLIKAMPNPKNIKLSNVNETINGVSVPLYKVEAGLNGKELVPWAKSYVLRLMQDDQGLKDAISPLYDAAKPVIDQAVKSSTPSEDPYASSIADSMNALLGEKETAVEVLHTEMKQMLVILTTFLNQAENPENGMLSDSDSFKAAIYVDNNMNIRKTSMELDVRLPESMAREGIAGVKASADFSYWNLNQPVKADVLSTEGAYSLEESTSSDKLLEQLDEQSVLSRFLKDDLHVTRKTAYFWVPDYWNAEAYGGEVPAYYEGETTMVQARHLADRLGLDIQWNDASRSVSLSHKSTGAQVTMTVDSTDTKVNGTSSVSPAPATMKNDTVYVPLRYVAEALGGHVGFDDQIGAIIVTLD